MVQFLGRKKDDNSYQTLTYRNIEVLAETTPSEDENGTDLPTDEQLAAAKTKADDLLDQWKNGDATADSFGELAKTNSADETNKDNGGLNEDANRSSLDANLTDWLFAEGRQPGDAAVVEASDSSGNVIGYQILYVESLGEIQWKYQATTALPAHHKNGLLEKKAILPAIFAGLAAAGLAAWISTGLDTRLLRKLFGLFLLYVGITQLVQRDDR